MGDKAYSRSDGKLKRGHCALGAKCCNTKFDGRLWRGGQTGTLCPGCSRGASKLVFVCNDERCWRAHHRQSAESEQRDQKSGLATAQAKQGLAEGRMLELAAELKQVRDRNAALVAQRELVRARSGDVARAHATQIMEAAAVTGSLLEAISQATPPRQPRPAKRSPARGATSAVMAVAAARGAPQRRAATRSLVPPRQPASQAAAGATVALSPDAEVQHPAQVATWASRGARSGQRSGSRSEPAAIATNSEAEAVVALGSLADGDDGAARSGAGGRRRGRRGGGRKP